MPPVRNIATIKPVKTERTHEENQERAYIAASRRSDRSLEARIESARRASEIHKKRTGRALRVTEQDVINEEMYEEEEEDLTAQYRRLTAHLQTGSIDFNRRFQAYIQSQAGTRMALASYDPAFANGGFQQPYPVAQNFNPQYMQMLPTNMIAPHMGPHSPQMYRQSPYPMPSPQSYGQQSHQRSASVAGPQTMPAYSTAYPQSTISQSRQEEHRRMSLPAQVMPMSSPLSTPPIQPQLSRAPSDNNFDSESRPDSPGTIKDESITPNAGSPVEQQANNQNHSTMYPTATQTLPQTFSSQQLDISPFSYSLPPETQLALGSSVEQSGFPAATLMAGSELLPQPNFYSYNPNSTSKSKVLQEHSLGLAGTLAPSAPLLDTRSNNTSMQSPLSATTATSDGLMTPYTPVFSNACLGLDASYLDAQKPHSSMQNDNSEGSLSREDWGHFLNFDDSPWLEN